MDYRFWLSPGTRGRCAASLLAIRRDTEARRRRRELASHSVRRTVRDAGRTGQANSHRRLVDGRRRGVRRSVRYGGRRRRASGRTSTRKH